LAYLKVRFYKVTKYVEAIEEALWTRVQLPPSPRTFYYDVKKSVLFSVAMLNKLAFNCICYLASNLTTTSILTVALPYPILINTISAQRLVFLFLFLYIRILLIYKLYKF